MKSSIGLIFWIILGWFLYGCSNTDETNEELAERQEIPAFTTIGEDLSSVYQYNYSSTSEEGTLINITSETGLSAQYLTLREVGDVLTFYTFSSGSFTALQRNARTGENQLLENFYTVSDEQSILWGANSENQLFVGYYSPRQTNNLGVRIIDIATGNEQDISIAAGVQSTFQPLYFKEKLLVSFLDGVGNYKTAILNTKDKLVLEILDFGQEAASILIKNDGDIAIFKKQNGNGYTYTELDFESLAVTDERSFSIEQSFAPGVLEANIADDQLYYLNFLAQPSPVLFAPAVYNFGTSSNTTIDIFSILSDFEQEIGEQIDLVSQGYNSSSNLFLLGYRNVNDNSQSSGGVLVVDANGNRIGFIRLPFIPTYFENDCICL